MSQALPRWKLVLLLYLLMRDAAPTGDVVAACRALAEVPTGARVVYTSSELRAYAERLAGEVLGHEQDPHT